MRGHRSSSDGTGLLVGAGCLVTALYVAWYLLIMAGVLTAIVLAWRNWG